MICLCQFCIAQAHEQLLRKSSNFRVAPEIVHDTLQSILSALFVQRNFQPVTYTVDARKRGIIVDFTHAQTKSMGTYVYSRKDCSCPQGNKYTYVWWLGTAISIYTHATMPSLCSVYLRTYVHTSKYPSIARDLCSAECLHSTSVLFIYTMQRVQ